MSKEKQILQLRSQGYSSRKIADILHVSRNNISKVIEAATKMTIPSDALIELNEFEIQQYLFPEKSQQPCS